MRAEVQVATAGPVMVRGAAHAYRLLDVGYSISLDRALDLLAASAPERVRPVRGEAAALQIPNPPVAVLLGSERVTIGGTPMDAELSARIFDFGVVSVRVRLAAPEGRDWATFVALGNAVDLEPSIPELLERHAQLLYQRITAAIMRPRIAPLREDYIVFRLHDATDAEGRALSSEEFMQRVDVAPLLLNERRPLSAAARAELLQHRFSYFADDLALLTWDNALVLERAAGETDVEFILEFANAQLLELRYYDAVLDGELPQLYDRIEAARGSTLRFFTRRYSHLLAEMQRLFADTTELVERAENSFKVTDDVYLARIYLAALEIFRGRAWRAGVDRKLTLVRETYEMLNGEAQAARAEGLEWAIVLLILAEIVMAVFR